MDKYMHFLYANISPLFGLLSEMNCKSVKKHIEQVVKRT